MNAKIVKLNWSAHREADALLPWYVNGSLSEDERSVVDKHVRACARCRREVDVLRRVQDAVRAIDDPPADVDAAMDRLLARIDRKPTRDAGWHVDRARRRIASWWNGPTGWARWVVAAPAALLLAIGVILVAMPGLRGGSYVTLGAGPVPSVAEGTIVVVFDPELPEGDFRRIIKEAGARLVDGPTSENAYVLEVPAAREARVLDLLRQRPGIRLAQPLTARAER